jgi:hypothetical protein
MAEANSLAVSAASAGQRNARGGNCGPPVPRMSIRFDLAQCRNRDPGLETSNIFCSCKVPQAETRVIFDRPSGDEACYLASLAAVFPQPRRNTLTAIRTVSSIFSRFAARGTPVSHLSWCSPISISRNRTARR